MEFAGFVALLVIPAAVALVVKGWDVRLVLLVAALGIAGAAGDVSPVLRTFLATFSDEKFVVPICSAMGFAYVLRHTGCERHLVLLLVKPIRYVRWLMVPGVIAVGFLVNIPVISQTSTAVCIGPVVVPLMRAAGYSMATIGACLLLGTSVGGELLNPGAPELLTVYNEHVKQKSVYDASPQRQAGEYLPPLVLTQLAVSAAVFWLLSRWWEKAPRAAADRPSPAVEAPGPPGAPEHINILKALVPLVPLVLLFAASPPLDLFHVPQSWVVSRSGQPAAAAVGGFPAAVATEARLHPSYNTRLIGLAMLVGVLVATLSTPGKTRDSVKQFFEGAGYGFANVVSLIVIANCFGAAIKGAGLAEALGRLIADSPGLMQPLAAFIPLTFGVLSGSGMASTQSLYALFYSPAAALGLDTVSIGSLVSLGAAAGRTMSPVSAVALMCATLSGTNSFALAKRVAVPLLAGMVVVVLLRMLAVL